VSAAVPGGGCWRVGRPRGRGAALLAGALAAAACTSDIHDQPAVAGAVATYRAPGVAFGGFATFARASRVGLVTDAESGKVFADAPNFLSALDSYLAARGYLKVAEPDPASPPPAPPDADLMVNVTALAVTGAEAGYWTAYGGYSQPADLGVPGYAWSYPWSWLPVTFLPGTLLVEISDLRGRLAGSPGQIVVVWAALAYGVAPGDAWDTPAATAALDQAFAQSAYLLTP
jgi:hypothetical protein